MQIPILLPNSINPELNYNLIAKILDSKFNDMTTRINELENKVNKNL